MSIEQPLKTGLFRRAGETRRYAAGDVIFREGDPGDAMYVVRSGRVRVEVGGSVINVVGEDEVFGEMAVVDTHVRSADAIADIDSEVVLVDRGRFEFMVQQTPAFGLFMLKVLAARIRRMNARLS